MSGTFAAGAISSSGTISGSLLKGQSVQAQVGNNLGYRFNLNDDSQINGVQYNVIGERAHLQIPSLPVSVTLPFSASATALVGGNLTVGGTTTIAGVTTTNGTLNAASGFQIGGVTVSSTAAELNKLDGFVGGVNDLNQLVKTDDDSIEVSKLVRYDADGAFKFKKIIKASSLELSTNDSGVLLMPSGAAAQTFHLPSIDGSKGVNYRFIAASAVEHILLAPAAIMQGYVMDNANDDTDSTMARTDFGSGVTRITLVNPKVGDRFTIVSDGEKYIVEGRTNDTPALA